jgi:hypothetical protein
LPGKVPMGTAPLFAILLLLFTLLYALISAVTIEQWFLRIATMTVMLSIVWYIWMRMAKRNPSWALGTAGQSDAVFLVLAIGLFFGADFILGTVSGVLGSFGVHYSLGLIPGFPVFDPSGMVVMIVVILIILFGYTAARAFL